MLSAQWAHTTDKVHSLHQLKHCCSPPAAAATLLLHLLLLLCSYLRLHAARITSVAIGALVGGAPLRPTSSLVSIVIGALVIVGCVSKGSSVA